MRNKIVLVVAAPLLIAGSLGKPADAESGENSSPANTPSELAANKPQDNRNTVGNSPIQILYTPADIIVDRNCESLLTAISVGMTSNTGKVNGLAIVGGSLQSRDSSSSQLPAQAFELLVKDSKIQLNTVCNHYTTAAGSKSTDGSIPSPIYIGLKKEWAKPGLYSGNLWIAATNDSGAQAVPLKVLVRPWQAWFIGITAISVGALISWYSVIQVTRQRQTAANQITIARLASLLDQLEVILNRVTTSGAPVPQGTVSHIQQLRRTRLRELLDDGELSAMAGITIPPAQKLSVIDEINGVNLVVQLGFTKLLTVWDATPQVGRSHLVTPFAEMDGLGAVGQQLDKLDQQIQTILNSASPEMPHVTEINMGPPPQLQSEDVVVHRIVAGTHVLDLLSLLTVILLGTYVLIWKNAGFGSIGNYLEAFLWGVGLKLGGDITKLAPGDVRTAFSMKIPGPPVSS